jgi:hypothetical protein
MSPYPAACLAAYRRVCHRQSYLAVFSSLESTFVLVESESVWHQPEKISKLPVMTKTLAQLFIVCGLGYFTSQGINADYDMAVSAYHRNDYASAYQELLPLAQSGDSRAQALVAMMYKYGEAVEVNYVEAFNWYLASANQGYPPAQYSLAELYEAGKGTPADPDLAHYWFNKAAEAGLSRAQEKLRQYELQQPGDSSGRPEVWSRDWNFDLPSVSPESTESQAAPDRASAGPVTAETQSTSPGYRVQLGAMKSIASANRLWDQINRPHVDLFQGQPFYLNSNQTSDKSLVKVQVGAFKSRAAAHQFCDQIKARGIKSGCLAIPAKPDLDLPRPVL